MHNGNGNWHDGMGGGNWWWIPMVILMVAFWAGLIWFGVTMLKNRRAAPVPVSTMPASTATAPRPTAQEILADRLARGEIEADDYRQRVAALLAPTPG
ncbi:MAG: hypothetical protein Q7V88_14360 [Actinomycetota bacterium]|nr:hypothetical protein [Actinomycetota bacterium]